MAIIRFGGRRVRGPRALSIIGRVFIGISAAALLAAAVLSAVEWASGRDARAEGIIRRIGREYPRIVFTAADGRRTEFRSAVRSSFWHDGDTVVVAYDPRAPESACIDGFVRWLLPAISAGIGTAFAALGLGLVMAGRGSSQASADVV